MQPSSFGYLKPTIGVAIVDLKIIGWPAVVLHIKDQRALSARQQGSKMLGGGRSNRLW
jgi:hypothetical protein